VRGVEPTGLQCVEVIVMEDSLPFRKPRPGWGRDLVPEPFRSSAQPISVVVDRPPNVVTDDKQA
jgi:hypothetical protein